MFDSDVQKIIEKLHRLRELHRARERVRQLERELNGEPAKPKGPREVPDYLRQRTPFL